MKRWNDSHIIKGVAVFLLATCLVESVLYGLGLPYEMYPTYSYNPMNWYAFFSRLFSGLYSGLLVLGLGVVTGLLHKLYASYVKEAARGEEGSNGSTGDGMAEPVIAQQRRPRKKGWNWGLVLKMAALLLLAANVAEAIMRGSNLFYVDYLSSQHSTFDWFTFFNYSSYAVYTATVLYSIGAIISLVIKRVAQMSVLRNASKPGPAGEVTNAVPAGRGRPDEVAALFGEGL